MTKGIVTCNLFKRKGSPSVNAEKLGFFVSGDEVEIENVVLGETKNDYYEGTPTWYQLTNGIYVWSGGVSLNLDEEVLEKKIRLDTTFLYPNFLEDSLDLSKITFPPQSVEWGKLIDDLPSDWLSTKGAGVKVAVLDSGLETTHPDLLHISRLNCIDVSQNSNNILDDNHVSHGTHCLGLIGAIKSDQLPSGISGVSPLADVFPVKVYNKIYSPTLQSVSDGIKWALSKGVDIISISIRIPKIENSILEEWINEAKKQKVIIVAAAGDNKRLTNFEIDFPASLENTIAVGALENAYLHSVVKKGTTIKNLDFILPYFGIWSCARKESGYYLKQPGSSMSTAILSGIISLIMAKTHIHKNKALYSPDSYLKAIKDHLLTISTPLDSTTSIPKNIIKLYHL